MELESYGIGFGVRVSLRRKVQLVVIDLMSETTVALSEKTWKVLLDSRDWKAAVTKAPPGRSGLLELPYCDQERRIRLSA